MCPSEEIPNTDLPLAPTQFRWIDTDRENSSTVLVLADARDLQIASWADLRQHHTAAAKT